jgi:hypothetical protein
MIDLGLKVTKRPPTAANIIKQITFGTAVGFTKTAKSAQAAVQGEVTHDFTYRNNWLPQSNKFGIRVKSAKPTDLTAEIYTAAGWLAKQKIGGTAYAGQGRRVYPYFYNGKLYVAIPSKDLRPQKSTTVLKRSLWPQNLKNRFVFKTKKKGTLVLAVRTGPAKKDIQIMYILVDAIQFKKKDAFTPPIQKVVDRELHANVLTGISQALATAK